MCGTGQSSPKAHDTPVEDYGGHQRLDWACPILFLSQEWPTSVRSTRVAYSCLLGKEWPCRIAKRQ